MSHALRYNLENQRFGRLVVIRHCTGHSNRPPGMRGAIWLCHCLCGKQIQVLGRNLRARKTRSCGCLRAEMSARRLRAIKARNLNPD